MSLFTTADIQALLTKYEAEGYRPFNAIAYAAKYLNNSQEKDAFATPLDHFREIGAARGYSPTGDASPQFFDAIFYAAKYPALGENGVIDAGDLFGHFLKFGVGEGRQASAYTNGFDSAKYLADYPGVAAYVNANLADFNGSASNGALAHFMKFGQAQGFLAFDINGVAFTKSGFPLNSPITFKDGVLDLDTHEGNTTLTAAAGPVVAPASGALRLTGDADVRIDLTQPNKQVFGIDLNGKNGIEANGIENNVSGANILKTSGFKIVDAYARNPLDEFDNNHNFLGDIRFDGASNQGDGVKTNGNIFLGGLGADVVLPGVGNDFIAGGGVAGQNSGNDEIQGGRNADFIYVELSRLQNTDGNGALVDGGITADNNEAGNVQSDQDTDWLLLEVQDDEEPITVRLEDALADENGNGNFNDDGSVTTNSGKALGLFRDIENVDASGNLYGFLNDYDVELGGRRLDDRDKAGTANYGLGSSGQLNVIGSLANNRIVGGYDNDDIQGNDGRDLLFGGNMQFFKETVKDGVTNPNLDKIVNDGIDRLDGGNGDDGIVLGLDGGGFATLAGGVYGGANDALGDTLYVTNYSLDRTAATEAASAATILQKDKFEEVKIRLDLDFANYSGYRGNTLGEFPEEDDKPNAETSSDNTPGTADQTVYAPGHLATKIVDMENIIASGMGQLDYLAAGKNSPELKFANQQNFFGTGTNLELRGTDDRGDPAAGRNTLYAAAGDDLIEGRGGNDKLSGGAGNDDFLFQLVSPGLGGNPPGDAVDVIHRQHETAPGSNITDGTFSQDFGLDESVQIGASQLKVDLGTTDLSSPDIALAGFEIKIGGVVFSVPNSQALNAAVNATEAAALVNAAYSAQDANVSAFAVGNVIYVIDKAGRDISDTLQEGFAVVYVVTNQQVSVQATFGPAEGVISQDRLIYKSYEDRTKNEGVDDDADLGSTISLGRDNYAEDLVISFSKGANGLVSTNIAEDQSYEIKFTNLAIEDIVKLSVNKVEYTLQVGVDLDGSLIPGGETNTQFVARLVGFINTFNDDDTAAGELTAAVAGDPDALIITQHDYNGEETVFMNVPVVTINNLSGGQAPVSAVTNTSEHQVNLFEFDGRDGALNVDNVLFVGEEFYNRAVLETATTAGGKTVLGSDAMVVYVQNGNNADNIKSATEGAALNGGEIAFNKAVNKATGATENFAVHGDDLLLGGAGADTILGGTGDDRIIGSAGADKVDGGKDLWLQDGEIKIYNEFDAAQADAQPDVINLTKIRQNEIGTNALQDGFEDTLQFEQNDFTSGLTRFTVTLEADLNRKNGGAGTVAIDANGDGILDAGQVTTFTNFENIRMVSGIGKAVAGTNGGQGRDTLDVAALSTLTGGITYILTNGNGIGDAGQVYINTGENFQHILINGDPNVPGDFGITEPGNPVDPSDNLGNDLLFITGDGFENVIGGLGNDTLVIDQTEADKDNVFTAGLGSDAVVYEDTYGTTLAFPTFTFKVNGGGADVDLVEQTDGRNGEVVATDTLISVESVDQRVVPVSSRENDVLDVTALANGATVNFVNNKVLAGGVEVLQLFGMSEYEIVKGSGGNDTVIISDAMFNSREDAGDGVLPADITFNSFLNFDLINDFTDGGDVGSVADDRNSDGEIWDRQSIEELRQIKVGSVQENPWGEGDIPEVRNLNQFTFELGAGNDTVDYSAETGTVAAVINFSANPVQHVMVDHTPGDINFADAADRIDALKGVENIVAGQGPLNIIDLSNSTVDVNVRFSSNFPNVPVEGVDKFTALDREVHVVRLTQQITEATIGGINLIEYRDLTPLDPDPMAVDQPNAVWNAIAGSDNNEYVEFTDDETGIDHFAILKGGDNEANYNELSNGGIVASIELLPFDPAGDPNIPPPFGSNGVINVDVFFTDPVGNLDLGLGQDLVTSHTAGNLIAEGSLRIEASQTEHDSFSITSKNGVNYVLGVGNDNTITVSIDENGVNNALTLTGFENLLDGPSDDVYFMDNLAAVDANLTFVDFVGPPTDRDTIAVTKNAIQFNAPANTISLGAINVAFDNFDFDVLDITKVVGNNLIVLGDANAANDTTDFPKPGDGEADDLILGNLGQIDQVGGFQDLWLTDASITSSGTSYKLDTLNNKLLNGSDTVLFETDAGLFPIVNVTSGIDASLVTSNGVTLEALGPVNAKLVGSAQADTITGGAGNDLIVGGKGKDVLEGGTAAETVTFELAGVLDAGINATYTIEIDGITAPVLLENGDFPLGGGPIAVGSALAAFINANKPLFDDGPGDGELAGASFDTNTNQLVITYLPGFDIPLLDTSVVLGGADAGTQVISLGVYEDGDAGGSDLFLFRAGDSTKVVTTADRVNGFDDVSDVIKLFQPDGVGAYVVAPGFNFSQGPVGGQVGFAAALAAANTAMVALVDPGTSVHFEWNNQVGVDEGYAFIDYNNDNVVDEVVIFTGIDTNEIFPGDFI